ncbi:MAG TPA: YceI family protein [Polyangiaceae bacterium]|nr:YceI family protein [Polyangiaceae bacterium]
MMRTGLLLTGLALSIAVGCNTDPGKGKPRAQVAAPVAATAAPASAVTYTFNETNSKVGYVGAKVTRKHHGSFGTFRGTVRLADADPTKSSVKVEIDTASIVSDDAKLTGHLKSPDFFDVQKFPKATFASTLIRAGGANGATHTVTGNLELHGVQKSITFPATLRIQDGSVAADAEFAINRKDFGIVYPGMPDDLIKEDVLIKLQLRADKTPKT